MERRGVVPTAFLPAMAFGAGMAVMSPAIVGQCQRAPAEQEQADCGGE
jgi:hypothetical protein